MVKVLDVATLKAGSIEPFTRLKGALNSMTGPDIPELKSNLSTPPAYLNVLKIYDSI